MNTNDSLVQRDKWGEFIWTRVVSHPLRVWHQLFALRADHLSGVRRWGSGNRNSDSMVNFFYACGCVHMAPRIPTASLVSSDLSVSSWQHPSWPFSSLIVYYLRVSLQLNDQAAECLLYKRICGRTSMQRTTRLGTAQAYVHRCIEVCAHDWNVHPSCQPLVHVSSPDSFMDTSLVAVIRKTVSPARTR